MASADPQISLIICSRNRATALSRCLEAINSEEIKECQGELILIDNGSTDGTIEVMRNFQSRSQFPVLVAQEAVAGLSRARNKGLSLATAPIISFTDDDCYLAPRFLPLVLEAFRSNDFDYCGGSVLLFDPTDSPYGSKTETEPEKIPPRSFVAAGELQGASMIIRRTLADRVGLFDIDLGAGTPFRCEDIDYCARASWAGFTGAYRPELIVYHHHGRKPGADIEALKRDNDVARGAYYAKCISSGYGSYFRQWLKRIPRHQVGVTWREFVGALHYWRVAARKKDARNGQTGM